MPRPVITKITPKIGYADHKDMHVVFKVDVRKANLGNHYEASIESGGKKFVARHENQRQAVADVTSAAHEAHRKGEIFPGVF